jgi:hypothetical protein
MNEKPNQRVRERKEVGIQWPRQCGILNISEPYRSPLPVPGIAQLLLFIYFIICSCC